MEFIGEQYALLQDVAVRKGGMAEIRAAVDTHNNGQRVAIKLFSSDLDASKTHLEAYSREAMILQRLRHPNIVTILDGGMDRPSGRRYLVLEWLDESLADHMKRAPVADWDDFYRRVGQPVLSALSYAFSQAVLHRDIKPQNVLLAPDGTLKLTDFGISKLCSLIAPGVTLSAFRSEPYAPPELDDGRDGYTRDVYAFAVLALASLSKFSLATRPDVENALAAFGGPPEIRAILDASISREPIDRQSSIVELAARLEAVQKKKVANVSANADLPRCFISVDKRVSEKLSHRLPGLADSPYLCHRSQ